MSTKKEKYKLHPRNRYQGSYDFHRLTEAYPALRAFAKLNPKGKPTIDFADPQAVRALNKALLLTDYGISFWELPPEFLCPPIPGRADYIHFLADLLANDNKKIIPKGAAIQILDIGIGANCIYPIIGRQEYGWSFTGSEINQKAIDSAHSIIQANSTLSDTVKIRKQKNPKFILEGIIEKTDYFDAVICNPPFHSSALEAQNANLRKRKNLSSKTDSKSKLNFGGQQHELWYTGGELLFIQRMIEQSLHYKFSVHWYTTLVSKISNLKSIRILLEKAEAKKVKVIEMGQGNKQSRFIAWTFLNSKQQQIWSEERWTIIE